MVGTIRPTIPEEVYTAKDEAKRLLEPVPLALPALTP